MKRYKRSILAVALAVVLFAQSAFAVSVNRTWIGVSTPGDWSVAGNWAPAAVPLATDNVYIPAGSPAITAGLNQSGVALGIVYFQTGYSGTVASSAAYLQLSCSTFIFSGTGQAYIDLSASAIDAIVTAGAQGSTGIPGLYLKGSALTSLAASGGNTILAGLVGETSSATTVRASGAGTAVALGTGVTVTTTEVSSGAALTINTSATCAPTTCGVYSGTLTTIGTGTVTTINVGNGGTCYPQSSGTVTNLNCRGGITDTTKFGVARTISNLKQNSGASFAYDPNVVTLTTRVAPDSPVRITAGDP